MKKRRIYIALHILIWIFISVLPFVLINNPEIRSTDFLVRWYTNTLLNAGIFYLFYGYINNRFLNQEKIGRYVLITAMIIPFYCLIRYAVCYFIFSILTDITVFKFGSYYFSSIIISTFFTGLAVFLNFAENWFLVQQVRQKAEKEKLESELKMLRQQINPHFLFNTLNNIHTLVYKKSDKAADAVLKLSGLMRYMLYESEGDVVLLSKEIEHINNFVELQKLRFTNPELVSMTFEGEPDGKSIAPLLLLPFIENAFKHVSNAAGSFIDIRIIISDSDLHFFCCNSFKPGIESTKNGGIGLNNVQHRLKLQYPGKHTLVINKNANTFEVNLTLTLKPIQ